MAKSRSLARYVGIAWPWAVMSVLLLPGCQPQERSPQFDSAPEPAPARRSPSEPQETGSAQPAASSVREEARGGVGEKGRGYGDGPVTTPVAAYFAVQERLVFDVQIPQAMNLYKAAEGRAPKTHDEFMRNIVAANQIRLPALPAGHRYVYDPKSERLMVEHPQQ